MKKIICIIICSFFLLIATSCDMDLSAKKETSNEHEIYNDNILNFTQVNITVNDGKIVLDKEEIKCIQIQQPILSKQGKTTYYYDGNDFVIRKKDSIEKISVFLSQATIETATVSDIQVGGVNNVYLVKILFVDNTYIDFQLKDGLIIGCFVDENGVPLEYDDTNDINSSLKNTYVFPQFDQFVAMMRLD